MPNNPPLTRAHASCEHIPPVKMRRMLIDYFDRQKCWADDTGDVFEEVRVLVGKSIAEVDASVGASRMLRIDKTYADFIVKRDAMKRQAARLATLCDAARDTVRKQEIINLAAILGHLDRITHLSADLKRKIVQLANDELKTLEMALDSEGAQ